MITTLILNITNILSIFDFQYCLFGTIEWLDLSIFDFQDCLFGTIESLDL